MMLKIALLVLFSILGVQSQENAANSVAPGLLECYNNTNNLDRERRLPTSINVLIALIRKVESGPYIQNDRELSVQLIHRFKQDGIVTFNTATNNPYVIPFTPQGIQADKNKILLRQLIPGSAANFPNSTLSDIERCSLHFMLSDTIDFRRRPNEQSECNRIGHYKRRVRRNDDVETFKPMNSRSNSRRGNLEQIEETDPNREIDTEFPTQTVLPKRATDDSVVSACPMEDGVVYTRWGAVQAGTVMAGIAAGRDMQYIQSKDGYTVDGRYAATLAGDLSEVTLHQGAIGQQQFRVGGKGEWNGTLVPRWYFVERNSDLEMTDAEIRGGLDGLIIAKNIEDWRNKARSLKISQILDMYYSPRGVFSKKHRACNRRELYYEVAPEAELQKQTIGFSFLLDDEAKLLGSISSDGIKAYGEKAVDTLNNYITSIQDLSCEVDGDLTERANTDILIVLDTQWNFDVIYPALAHLLDNIEVNPYGSNFTIINAQNGEIIVNSTNSILDFYHHYNRTTDSNSPTGTNFPQVLNVVEDIVKQKMNNESNDKSYRGKSSIVLFIPYSVLSQNDKSSVSIKKDAFRTYMPDLKILVLGKNAKDAYGDLVFDSSNDAFDLSDTSIDGTSITQSVNQVVSRIKEIHRRITNPKCGSDMVGESGSEGFDQYIDPNSAAYYKVAPNYFFGEGERTVKFQGYGYGNLVVCSSRQNGRPSQNDTSGGNKCETISGTNVFTFSLTDGCRDYDTVSSCPPMYFSVTATSTGGESTNIRCIDSGCRFPDSVKYAIQIEQLGCYSASLRVLGNVLLISTLITISVFSSW